MRDVLIITPTRRRPANARRLAETVAETCTAETDLVFAVDDDDRSHDGLDLGAAEVVRGPRRTLGQWTNDIAAERWSEYRALASLGDDHVPRTRGWDSLLLAAINGMGGTGFAYGDDLGQRQNLATAVMASTDIVEALGWFMLPCCAHYHVDNAWMDLGRGAGCLAYVPEAVIEHAHPFWGHAPMDDTYESELGRGTADQAAYEQWRAHGLDGDVAKVKGLLK